MLHVMASVLAIPILALLAADVYRSTNRTARLRVIRAAVGGVGLAGLVALPLVIHELSTGFAETRTALQFLAHGREAATPDLIGRLAVVATRTAVWPIAGLVVDVPVIAQLLVLIVPAAGILAWWTGRGARRSGALWLLATLAWSAVTLGLLAPELTRVVVGLPNDHYHAFVDPVVPILLGLGIAALVRGRAAPEWLAAGTSPERLAAGTSPATNPQSRSDAASRRRREGPILALVVIVGLLGFEVSRIPTLQDPNGGWPAALAAAERVVRQTGGRTLGVVGLPDFKPVDGFVFPLRYLGSAVVSDSAGDPGALVVVCDRLFEPVMPTSCGGDAERAIEWAWPSHPRLVDRFDLSARTSISVYLPASPT
jgi:hypothetical protein